MSVSAVAVERDRVQRDLWARTATAAGELNRAHAQLVDVAVELIEGGHWGDGGFRSPEHYFTVRAGLSPAHARDVVVVARRRAELPDTAAAVSTGELSLDAAAVVAHHVPTTYQASMTHLARHATVPQLRRVVSRHSFDDPGAPSGSTAEPLSPAAASPDSSSPDQARVTLVDTVAGIGSALPGFTSEAERRACARPELSMHYDKDGRFQLRYSAPATIGALVEQAVKEAKDALFQQEGDPDHVAPTYADAMAEIAHRSLAGVVSTSRASHYRVYLHLDTGGAWVTNRGAIPQRLVQRFLTEGTLQPVWETEGRPVSVGRTMRILPALSRRLIEDRDRGCRFPGCTATRFVEIHHLHDWASGGATDIDNQISLCPVHHDAVGRGDFTITGDPSRHDGLTVVNRYGHRLRPPEAHELAPPDSGPGECTGPPTYRPPTGEPARWSEIDVLSDRELEDTFTPRLLVLPRSDLPADAPAVPDRDPFDAYRRWDESG